MTETEIRAIVRDELRALAGRDAEGADPVRLFLATLPDGEEVGATALYQRFQAFHPSPDVTPRGFALRALRTGMVTRRVTRTGRVYVVAARALSTPSRAA